MYMIQEAADTLVAEVIESAQDSNLWGTLIGLAIVAGVVWAGWKYLWVPMHAGKPKGKKK